MAPAEPVQLLPGGTVLRKMTAEDLTPVYDIERNLFPVDAWPLEMFLAELSHPSRTYMVLERAEKIVGYAGAMTVADIADIQTIAVLPEYQGRGLGSALLDSLHRQVQARGAQKILLEVRSDNPRAQELYRLKGYQHIHTRERYYRDGTDALVMQKILSRPQGEKDRD